MVNTTEMHEGQQAFNKEIWQRTVAAVGDQFPRAGFHSRPGLAFMSWSDETGGLLLPSPAREVQEQNDIRKKWAHCLKPTESPRHLSTPVAQFTLPENERFNSGPSGLLTSLDRFQLPTNLETGEGPTVYSWLLQQKTKVKNVAIMGAVTARPVNAYYSFFKENGFNCNLHVIDVSPVPLAQTKAYMELGYMNDPSVKVIVHDRVSILNLTDARQRGKIYLPPCDIAISDLLTGYVYPDEDHPELMSVYYENISDLLRDGFDRKGGYLLTREQALLGDIDQSRPTGIREVDIETIDPDTDRLNMILKQLGEPPLDKETLARFYQNLYPPFLATSQPDVFKGAASRFFDRINGVHIVVPKLSAVYSTEIMHAKPDA